MANSMSRLPLILGIETSCDETSAAVLEGDERILSNLVLSQAPVHRIYGGVVPELASREHLRAIVPIVREALATAGKSLAELDLIAVTQGPGLAGALLVGLTYAKSLSWAAGKPLIGVNHLEGHIQAVLLEQRRHGRPEPEWPAVALVVSGGHTMLYLVEPRGAGYHYLPLGRTRDDAAGEAYDKVAKLLALSYPGGPIIDRLACFGREDAIPFPRVRLKTRAGGESELDFSFSGLKTAVLRYVQTHADLQEQITIRRQKMSGHDHPGWEAWRDACSQHTLDLLASFQASVVHELASKALRACELRGARSLLVSGGVAANCRLRRSLEEAVGPACYAPALELCTDNAAMIAAAAYPHFLAGERLPLDARAFAVWPL